MTELTDAHFELHSSNKARRHQEKKKEPTIHSFLDDKQTTMLVDADLLAYKITSKLEEPIDWGNDQWTLHCDFGVAKQLYAQALEYYMNLTNSNSYINVWSDSINFRKLLDSDYKSNRKKIRKPVCYKALREWVIKTYRSEVYKNLEADDTIGILATGEYKNKSIIISGDKDMRTIPAFHCSMIDNQIEKVDENLADYNFCTQVLTGDQTDGYKGCVGVGHVKASRLLDNKKTLDENWKAVIEEYQRNKYTVDDAYHQSRLARILRDGEYNLKTNKPTLWSYEYAKYRNTGQSKKAS